MASLLSLSLFEGRKGPLPPLASSLPRQNSCSHLLYKNLFILVCTNRLEFGEGECMN